MRVILPDVECRVTFAAFSELRVPSAKLFDAVIAMEPDVPEACTAAPKATPPAPPVRLAEPFVAVVAKICAPEF